MDISVRKAEIQDISVINKIQKSAFKDSYDKYKFCPAYEATDEQIESYFEKAYVYKIVMDDMIVGSIFIYKMGENHYELDTITINPQYLNLGLGTKVIGLVEEIHSDALIWTLQTPEKDNGNRHLYEKLGYKQIGIKNINEYLNLIQYKKTL